MKKQNSNIARGDILSVRADTAAIRFADYLLQWIAPHYGLNKEEDGHVRHMCFSVGSMMDESLFARYGVQAAAQSGQQDKFELVTELQALLIYRSIFAGNPPAEMLTVGKVFLPLIQVDSETGERM
jgi:hypothetical protein